SAKGRFCRSTSKSSARSSGSASVRGRSQGTGVRSQESGRGNRIEYSVLSTPHSVLSTEYRGWRTEYSLFCPRASVLRTLREAVVNLQRGRILFFPYPRRTPGWVALQ